MTPYRETDIGGQQSRVRINPVYRSLEENGESFLKVEKQREKVFCGFLERDVSGVKRAKTIN